MNKLFTAALIASSLALASVSSLSSAQNNSVTVKHHIGESTFASPPKRVVALGEEMMELLIPLGIKPVGYGSSRMRIEVGKPVSGLSYYDPEQLGNATFVGNALTPALETILALKPDLILVWGTTTPVVLDNLRKIAPTIGWDFNRDAVGWREAFISTAQIFNLESQAQTNLKKYDSQIRQLRARVSPIVARSPKVTSLFLFNEQNTGVFGPKFGFSLALLKLGFKLIAIPGVTMTSNSFQPVTPEALARINSDVVIYLRAKTPDGVYPELLSERILKQTKVPTYRYLLDVQEPQSGPITDLRRIEGISKLLLGSK